MSTKKEVSDAFDNVLVALGMPDERTGPILNVLAEAIDALPDRAVEAVLRARESATPPSEGKPTIPASAVLARGGMTTHGSVYQTEPLIGKDGHNGDGQPHQVLIVDADAVTVTEETA